MESVAVRPRAGVRQSSVLTGFEPARGWIGASDTSNFFMALLDAAAGVLPLSHLASRLSILVDARPVLFLKYHVRSGSLRVVAASEAYREETHGPLVAAARRELRAIQSGVVIGASGDLQRRQALLSHGRHYVACLAMPASDGSYCCITCGSDKGDAVPARTKQTIDEVLPYVGHALSLEHRVSQTAARAAAHEAVLDRLPFGVVQLDDTAALVHANATAFRIVQRCKSLSIRASGFHATKEGKEGRLQAAIAQAIKTQDSSFRRRISIQGSDGAPACSVLVTSLKEDDRPPGVRLRTVCLVFVADPDLPQPPSADAVAEALGLTTAESRVVAALASGTSLPDAAAMFGISINTARTLLARAMARTGVNSQIGLVREVLIRLGPILDDFFVKGSGHTGQRHDPGMCMTTKDD
jgi:DNA-binding CsgD family transcriptional regulator